MHNDEDVVDELMGPVNHLGIAQGHLAAGKIEEAQAAALIAIAKLLKAINTTLSQKS